MMTIVTFPMSYFRQISILGQANRETIAMQCTQSPSVYIVLPFIAILDVLQTF